MFAPPNIEKMQQLKPKPCPSQVPLGVAGFQVSGPKKWGSTYVGEYRSKPISLAANQAMAAAVSAMFNGARFGAGQGRGGLGGALGRRGLPRA